MTAEMLSEFPERFDNPFPLLNAEGILPPGDFAPTHDEFRVRFVEMGDTNRRRLIYEGWNKHREALLRVGIPSSGRQLLNGSFTTAKPSPGDIDIAVEVPVDENALDSLTGDHPIVKLLLGSLMKFDYYCDAYPIYSLPPRHPLYQQVTGKAIRYWTKWYGHTRGLTPKGRVWATTGGLR